MNNKSLSPLKKCIFCGRIGKNTREHVWPKWLTNAIPNLHETTTNNRSYWNNSRPLFDDFPKEQKSRGGSLTYRTLKCVCGPCNNGWMSDWEQIVAPIATPVILGEKVALNALDQTILAAWIAKTMMVAQYFHPTQVTIPQSDRTYLMNNLMTPNLWQIWIGHTDCVGLDYYNYAAQLGRDTPDPQTESGSNIQCSSIKIGRFIAVAISQVLFPNGSRMLIMRQFENIAPRLWPLAWVPMTWPRNRALNNDETI